MSFSSWWLFLLFCSDSLTICLLFSSYSFILFIYFLFSSYSSKVHILWPDTVLNWYIKQCRHCWYSYNPTYNPAVQHGAASAQYYEQHHIVPKGTKEHTTYPSIHYFYLLVPFWVTEVALMKRTRKMRTCSVQKYWKHTLTLWKCGHGVCVHLTHEIV